ncbi:MAG TPA: hypothetical protein VHQ65_16535 [Thermoanaerobaculia bacterium]|nr:hypothetical protein [Thermoanaerobaculia bacterium]
MKKTTTLLCLAALIALAGLPALAEEAPEKVDLEVLLQAPAGQCEAPAAEAPSVALSADPIPWPSRPCNQAVCSADEFCCNYSCSICAPRGGYCTQQYCPPVS